MAYLYHRSHLDCSNGNNAIAPFAVFYANENLPDQTPETSYLTLTLRAIGFDTFETNLLVIPSSVLFILQLLFWTWLSEKWNQRLLIGLISQIWTIPLLVALETLPKTFHGDKWVRYAISSLIVGYPYAHAMLGTFGVLVGPVTLG